MSVCLFGIWSLAVARGHEASRALLMASARAVPQWTEGKDRYSEQLWGEVVTTALTLGMV